MKLLILIAALGIGFGTGVYWGVHHPVQAAQLSAEEERRFIELQLKTSEAVKQKLDQLASRRSESAAKTPGSGFLSSRSASAGPDPEIASVRDQQDQQIQELRQRLDRLKK